MVNIRKIRARMVEKGVTAQEMADCMGINRSTLYRKFQQPDEQITVRDVRTMAAALDLQVPDAVKIFFDKEVADMRNEVAE